MKETWRRQQARDAMQDRLLSPRDGESEAVTISEAAREAVVVATTVKITEGAIKTWARSYADAQDAGVPPGQRRITVALKAALEELGFEVEV